MTEHRVWIPEKTRDKLREYADDRDMTYSEALLELLPEDETLSRGVPRQIAVGDEAYERLESIRGEGVDRGEVIAYYLPNGHE